VSEQAIHAYTPGDNLEPNALTTLSHDGEELWTVEGIGGTTFLVGNRLVSITATDNDSRNEIAIRDSQSGELTTEELGVLPDDFGYRETGLELPIVQPNIQSQVLVQTKHDCCMGSTSDRAYYLIWDCNR
jgi:hypothetical protein